MEQCRFAGYEFRHILKMEFIEIGTTDGVTPAKRIRKENELVQIVFITGFPDFMAEGYEVSALHYLMKPVAGKSCLPHWTRLSKISIKRKSSFASPLIGTWNLCL